MFLRRCTVVAVVVLACVYTYISNYLAELISDTVKNKFSNASKHLTNLFEFLIRLASGSKVNL